MPSPDKLKDIKPDKDIKAALRNAPRMSLVSQSGLQIATGGYSLPDSRMREKEAQQKKALKEAGVEKKKDDEPKPAPLLWVYPVAVVAGVVLGFVLPGGAVRKGLLIGCCGLGLGIIGIQAAIGFPIQKDIKDADKQLGLGRGGGPGDDLKVDDIIKTRYQIPFYLTLLLLVGGVVTAALEPAGAKQAGRNRYRRREDDDDDDYGQEEPLSLDDDEPEPERKPKPKPEPKRKPPPRRGAAPDVNPFDSE